MNNNDHIPLGIICTPAQYERSLTDSSIHCLTRSQSIGLTVVAEAGLVSLVAVSYVFTIILRNIGWRIRRASGKALHVFDGPMDLLMFSLFSADVLQAIGAVMSIKWIQDGKVEVGGFCRAQGIVQQLGETGVAMTTLVIAVYTFLGVCLGKDIKSMPIWITQMLMAAICLFIMLMITLGNVINRDKHFATPTPYYCWIGADYLHWRIWGEYFWFWITLAVSFVTYIPLYLWVHGNLLFDEHTWWKFTLQRVDLNADPERKVIRRRSLVMLAYPIVYCISILPLSIARWTGFIQERGHRPNHVPSTATFAVVAIYGLSGACNVVLLLTTRPGSTLFCNFKRLTAGHASSLCNSLEQSSCDLTENGEGEDIGLGRLPSQP